MPNIPAPPPAIANALHLIAASPLGSRTQSAAVEVLGNYLRTDGPAPPHDETSDALAALSVALTDELLATGAEWAALGLSYAGMSIASIRNRAAGADAPQPPHPPTAGGS